MDNSRAEDIGVAEQIAVLGGTGFIGREMIARWPASDRARLRILIHRSYPAWLKSCGAAVLQLDLTDCTQIEQALSGASTLINLLRPHGDGWLQDMVGRLVEVLPRTQVHRLVHASSIDVYGATTAATVTEETTPVPQTGYEREHLAVETMIERLSVEVRIARLGAIFGVGGRNIVAFVEEAQYAPNWKLAARRALYGRRRMHLVSVEKAADAIRFLALNDEPLEGRFLVTDDDALENNFAYLQDLLMRQYGRGSLEWVPELPSGALRAALALRGRKGADPMRRFSADRLRNAGFNSESFTACLLHYVQSLRPVRPRHENLA